MVCCASLFFVLTAFGACRDEPIGRFAILESRDNSGRGIPREIVKPIKVSNDACIA